MIVVIRSSEGLSGVCPHRVHPGRGGAGECDDGGEVDFVGVDVGDDCRGDGEAYEGVLDGGQSVDFLFGKRGGLSA